MMAIYGLLLSLLLSVLPSSFLMCSLSWSPSKMNIMALCDVPQAKIGQVVVQPLSTQAEMKTNED